MSSPAEQAIQFKNKGNTAFQEGRYQEAVDFFTKAIELNASDHVFFSNRSGAYASLSKYKEALADATTCVGLKPDWAKGYQRKGLAEFYLESYDEAEKTYLEGLKLDPNNQQLKEGLERVREEQNNAKGGPGKEFYAKMMGKLLANPKTANYLKDPGFVQKMTAIQKNPQMMQMYLGDPMIQEAFQVMFSDFDPTDIPAGGKFDEEDAKDGCKGQDCHHSHSSQPSHHDDTKEAPRSQPKPEEPSQKRTSAPSNSTQDPAEAEKNLGNEAYKRKDFVKAHEHYERAIELNPNEVLYYSNNAAVFIEEKEYQKALEACDKALEIADTLSHKDFAKIAKVYARKGSVLEKLNRLEEAISFYEKSLLEDQNQKVKEDLRRVQKAKKDADALAYINPEKAEEHNNLGKQLFQEGKFPAALKEYEEAIKRNPKDAKLYSNKAAALVKLLEFPTALREIDKALELDPKFVRAWARKGNIHFSMKEYHRALDAFEQGMKLEPENAECKEGHQKVQIAMMSSESAKDQEERAAHAMADPEIQAILKNPSVMNVLRNMQENPSSPENLKALRDPVIGAQIQKLIAAGILKTG